MTMSEDVCIREDPPKIVRTEMVLPKTEEEVEEEFLMMSEDLYTQEDPLKIQLTEMVVPNMEDEIKEEFQMCEDVSTKEDPLKIEPYEQDYKKIKEEVREEILEGGDAHGECGKTLTENNMLVKEEITVEDNVISQESDEVITATLSRPFTRSVFRSNRLGPPHSSPQNKTLSDKLHNTTDDHTPLGMRQVEDETSRAVSSSCVAEETAVKKHVAARNETGISCMVCRAVFYRKEHLNSHMRNHVGQKLYCCGICGVKFRDVSSLNVHMPSHFMEVSPVYCSVCATRFHNKKDLMAHRRLSTGTKYHCGVCNVSFTSRCELKVHKHHDPLQKSLPRATYGRYCLRETIVPRSTEMFCNDRGDCVEELDIKSNYKQHSFQSLQDSSSVFKTLEVESLHSESAIFSAQCSVKEDTCIIASKKRFTCIVCTTKFSDKCALNTHMRTHTGEKPFKCTVCTAKFSQKCALRTHMRTHTGEKPFSCTTCTVKFSDRSTLTKHMRTHTGEKPFKCTVCTAKFSQKCALRTHMRTHTGEKPFKCTVCTAKFSQKCALRTHMCTHTGEKPFSCTTCTVKFSDRSTLTKHIRIHTGEKPFACKMCTAKFTNSSGLTRHMHTHTVKKRFPMNRICTNWRKDFVMCSM